MIMVISEDRKKMYESDDEDIYCLECSDMLVAEEAFTCKNCSTDFCKLHIKTHDC